MSKNKRKNKKRKNNNYQVKAKKNDNSQIIRALEIDIQDYKRLLKNGRKNNLKVYSKRVFGTSGHFVLATLPFTIVAVIVSGVFYFSGYGLPFVKDDLKYKNYIDGHMDSIGNYSVNDSYKFTCDDSDYFYDATVYEPWNHKSDNMYERSIYKYAFDTNKIDVDEINGYVKSADYKSLEKVGVDPMIIFETSKDLTISEDDNKYFIESDFYYYDNADYYEISESIGNNVLVTASVLVLGCIGEGLLAMLTDGEIFNGVSNSITYGYIEDLSEIKQNIKNKEEELTLIKGGKSNGKKKR